MTTIICEMDSMELCVWKEKHLQRACSGDEWIFREKEKEPEGIQVGRFQFLPGQRNHGTGGKKMGRKIWIKAGGAFT